MTIEGYARIIIDKKDELLEKLQKENELLNRKVNELELYKKAFCMFVDWADECGFGYDNLDDLSEKYKKELEEKDLGYIEGLMYIALCEAKNENSDFIRKCIDNVDKVFGNEF